MFDFLSCSFKFPGLLETQWYLSPNCEIAARPMLIECNYPDHSSNPHSFIPQMLTEYFPGSSHCIRHWGALRIQRFCSVLKELPIYYRDRCAYKNYDIIWDVIVCKIRHQSKKQKEVKTIQERRYSK